MGNLSIERIKGQVNAVVRAYNAEASMPDCISQVSLFGSYADGRANDRSDVDLLVRFQSPVVSLITLGRVLDLLERAPGVSVDVVQDPLPEGSLLQITKVVPLYEGA